MSTGEQHIPSNYQEEQLAVIRREINIRSYNVIKGIMGYSVIDSLPLRMRCECSVPLCEEVIEVSLSRRRKLRRSYPRGFIVVLSHANSSQDITLYKTDEFSVVEKLQFTETVTDL